VKPDPALASEQYAYLTTTGRVTGKAHTIEIWFALENGVVYLMAGGGGRSDWVRNLRRKPDVSLRIRDQRFAGRARIIGPLDKEDALARRLLVSKYANTGYGGDLSSWGRTALPVAIDFD
jgi:deazaflavin-dependent oxidoreductase (nitroreductase family)